MAGPYDTLKGHQPATEQTILIPVEPVGPPSGVAAIDTLAIQAAINTAAAAGGGTVRLQNGVYNVSSFRRIDSAVTYTGSGSNYTWTDSSITAADVGRYVIVNGVFNMLPQILSVTAGSGFVTDNPPQSAVSSQSAWIVGPGLVMPASRVKLIGAGAVTGGGTGNYFASSPVTYGTVIQDSGSGITLIMRGSNAYGTGGTVADMSFSGVSATTGAAGGIYIGNNSWFANVSDVDTSYYKEFGIGLDGNCNMVEMHRWSASTIGSSGTTATCGGLLVGVTDVTTSATVNLYNCNISNLFGMGVGAAFTGDIGAVAVGIHGCQIWNISPTPSATTAATYSGYGAVLQSTINGACSIDHGSWFGTNSKGDVWLNTGTLLMKNCTMSTNNGSSGVVITTWGTALNLIDVHFSSGGTISNLVSVNNSCVVNWMGLDAGGHTLYSGGPSATNCLAVGSSAGLFLNNTAYTSP